MVFMPLSACATDQSLVDLTQGLPDTIYDQEPLYDGEVNSIGTLTEAYINNTESLIIVNGRLKTLCLAHRVCEETELE